MRKTILGLLIIILISSLVGCTSPSTDLAQKITPPKSKKAPIQGTWEIRDTLDLALDEIENKWLGKRLQFSENQALLGDYLIDNPQYKMKLVDTERYLLYNHKSFPQDFTIPLKQIEIITITDENRFFSEILKLKNEELILKIHNYSFRLEKVSENVDNNLFKKAGQEGNKKNPDFPDNHQDELTRTGLLLGLRSPIDEENSKTEYQYRTLWIAAKNGNLSPILKMKDLFFPRISGFWKIEVERKSVQDKAKDFIYAYSILTDPSKKGSVLGTETNSSDVFRRISYVGNDYLAIEELNQIEKENTKSEESKLRILTLDSIPNIKRVAISDLSGQAAATAYRDGQQKLLSQLSIDNKDLLNQHEEEVNFGLERKMGHWFFKGRINYIVGDKVMSADYSINAIPTPNLVSYDELFVPWTEIKDQVPGAVDAFTSPNRDLAIIFSKNELIIYRIEEGQLEKSPLKRISLKQGETVIMGEWATGDYVESWEKTFLATGGSKL